MPLSYPELLRHHGLVEETRNREQRIIFGSYPGIVVNPADARRNLEELAHSYLLKDVLNLEGVRKPKVLQNIVFALAHQTGSEVSLSELGQTTGADRTTVDRYITILEQAFIVFSLPSYSTNERAEVRKRKKVYFYDNGMLNAVRHDVDPFALRAPGEIGPLWENYLVSERTKLLVNRSFGPQQYFWRNTAQAEVDYIESGARSLHAWEFKWNSRTRAKLPAAFRNLYPEAVFDTVTPDTVGEFLV